MDKNKKIKTIGGIILILVIVAIVIIKCMMIVEETKEKVRFIKSDYGKVEVVNKVEEKVVIEESIKNDINRNKVLVSTERNNLKNNANATDENKSSYGDKVLSLQKIELEQDVGVQKIPGMIDIKQDDSGEYYSYEVEKAFADPGIGFNGFKFRMAENLKSAYFMTYSDNGLYFSSQEYPYECKMFVLSNDYLLPTEEEIYTLESNQEYIDLFENGESAQVIEEYRAEYFRNLGYTSKVSPDYAVTNEQFSSLFNRELLGDEWHIDKTIEYRPGYIDYGYYPWGKVMLCRIPKEQIIDGEIYTSDFSGCAVIIEYYDVNSGIHNYLSLIKE